MRNNSLPAFLTALQSRAGQKIRRKDLISLYREGGEARDSSKSKAKRPRKGRAHAQPAHDPGVILSELELVGLLSEVGSSLRVREPFTLRGRASISPSGAAFVTVRGADPMVRDVFVAPGDARGALTGDEVEIRLRDRRRDRFSGVVLRVIERARQLYRLKLLAAPKRGAAPVRVLDTPQALTATLKVDRAPSDIRGGLRTDVVVIGELSGRRLNHEGVYGFEAEFVRFENDSDLDPDYARILMKYNLDPVYPSGIDLPDPKVHPAKLEGRAWKSRQDLRGLETITIDGADSKDFDDAISLDTSDRELWKLYVHIADVSLYVKPGTELDIEARRRSTSVYLTNRVVPMLPPVISENLCSLVARTERPAFTAEMEVQPKNGKITASRFYRSIIEVDQRWTYSAAEEEIERAEKLPPGKQSLIGKLWLLAQRQRAKRMKSGRVDIDLPEPVLETDADHQPTGYSLRPRLRSSLLIEECMLSANIATAKFLRKARVPVLYRVHEPMEQEKLERLNLFFELYNVDCQLEDSSYPALARAQRAVAEHPNAERIQPIFNMLLLRSFMQAKYQRKPIGHWGLGFGDYCHFTSPIRRYPDLVVHRALDHALSKKKPLYTEDEIDELGILTSERERRAMDAERDLTRLKLIRLVEAGGRKRFRGALMGFKSDRVFVQIEDPPIEGVVAMTHLTNESELLLPNDFSVYVKRLSRPAFLGESWGLELERTDPEAMTVYFRPIWPEVEKPFA